MSQRYDDNAQHEPSADTGVNRIRVSQPHDTIEREAEALTAQAMSGRTPGKSSLLAGSSGGVSGGQALDAGTRKQFEPRFGADFSAVRVHADAAAHTRARRMEARAYTHGRDIVFAQGEYAPGTVRGQQLLAHELGHVVQQSRTPAATHGIARQPADAVPWQPDEDGSLYYGSRAEAEARMAALQKKGEWQEFRVSSFQRKVKDRQQTFWRVEMRGRKQAPAEEKPAPQAPPAGEKKEPGAGAKKDEKKSEDSPDAGPKPAPENDGSKDAGTDQRDAGADAGGKDAAPAGAAKGGAGAGAGGTGATHVFSLTFDDGPHSAALGGGTNRTEKVLDTLKAKGVKAGFFIQTGVAMRGGSAVGQSLVARMQAEGHTVGIHTGGTTDHESHPSAQKAGRLESELKAGQAYITKQTGAAPNFVRPPFGASNAAVTAVYKKVGLTNLLWDIDGDVSAKSLTDLQARLNSSNKKAPGIPAVAARGWAGTTPAHPKIVVLYHDIRANTADNIGAVIDHIRAVTKTVSGGKDTADFAPP